MPQLQALPSPLLSKTTMKLTVTHVGLDHPNPEPALTDIEE